ncbi:DUF1629 domain-containing protein [Salmonella enterica]
MVMKLYILESDIEEYSFFLQLTKGDCDNSIKSKAMHEQKWKEFDVKDFIVPEFELRRSQSGKLNYQFDISSFLSPFFIFSEKAIEALKDILESRGQFLPVKTSSKKKRFTGYYPTNVLSNAIDIEKSGMKDYDYKNMGIKIKNLHFKKGTILDEFLFTVSESNRYVFVTEKFRQRVEEAGLKGFDFINYKPINTVIL